MTKTRVLLAAYYLAIATTGFAQDGPPERRAATRTDGPWFGLPLPPPPGAEPAVIVGTRAPRPVTLPPGEAASPELSGAAIRADLETIVGFSRESRYGTNFISAPSDMESGETGGFSALKVARVTVMQAPPLYHTTGEVLDVISTPGLERMARFLAFFVREVAAAPRARMN